MADHQHPGSEQFLGDRRAAEQEVHPGFLQIVEIYRVVEVALSIHVAPPQRALVLVAHPAILSAHRATGAPGHQSQPGADH